MNFLLAVFALVWLAAAQDVSSRAATGLGSSIWGGALVPALRGVFVVFLTALGLQLAHWRGNQGALLFDAGLIRRPGATREWALGVAVAWGIVVACVFPLFLFHALQVTLWWNARAWVALVLSVVGLVLGSLATEVVYRSYALQRLSAAVGRTAAIVLLVLLYGVIWGSQGPRTFLVASGLGMVFSVGWLRTHAVWLSWGLHFGWSVGLGVLFGLPLLEGGDASSIVLGQVLRQGRRPFPALGPSGMMWTVAMLCLGAVVLVRVTRDLAWRHTHPVIVPAGYPMEARPPAAHVAMQAAAPPPPLVQILPTTGGSGSGPRGSS